MKQCKTKSEEITDKQKKYLGTSLDEIKESEIDTVINALQHNAEYHRMYCELESL